MDVADLYVAVLPETSRFGALLDRGISTASARSGAKAGKVVGTKIESEAARNTTGKFLTSNAPLQRSAAQAGLRVGKLLATGIAKQAGSTIIARAGTAIGNKLYERAVARIKGSRWEGVFTNPKVLAAAGAAGLLIGRRIVARMNGEMRASGGTGLGGIGQRAGAALKGGILSKAGIGGIGGIIAGLIGGGIFSAVKGMAQEASDLNETISKSRNVFGQGSKSIERWARRSATSLGLAQGAALEGTASFGNLFDQLGIGGKRAVDMSKGFVQMASDAASFNNADPSEVMDAFLSATRGEYDALQRFVPTASAATIQAEALRLTHKKSTKDLTAADQATALYSVAVRDMGKAHGDFARTSGGFANQQRILAANWANLRVQIGQFFLPMFTKAVVALNTEGFPAFKRIVRVVGDVATSAGRMGRAILGVFSTKLATELDHATLSFQEIADWFQTHQETMVRFFLRLGDAALDFGQTLVDLAAGGIRSFGRLAGGLAQFLDDAIPGLQGVMEGIAGIIDLIPGMGDSAAKIRASSQALGEGGRAAAAGLRGTQRSANEAADALQHKMNPIFDAARNKLHAVGQEEIWKARQRDAAARASIAIRDIGVKGDYTRLKLKGYNLESGRGSTAQRELAARVHAARDRMVEQWRTGQKAGDTQAELTKRWDKGKEALYREFRQMGYSKEEARKLTEQYGKVPGKKETKVTQPGMKAALTDSSRLASNIQHIPTTKQVTITFSAKTFVGADGVRYHVNTSAPSAVGRAKGGILPGYTPLSKGDDIAFPMARGGIQPLRGGEGIAVSEAMRDPYERNRLLALNKLALSGRSLSALQGKAEGGIILNTARYPRALQEQPGAIGAMVRGYESGIGNALGKAVAHAVAHATDPGGPVVGTGSQAHRALGHVGGPWTVGMCLQFVRMMAGAPGGQYSASTAWRDARYKHRGSRNPPSSTSVFWGGGLGHVAVSVGNGKIVTTDFPRRGRVGLTSISRLSHAWGKPYLGWTNDINGVLTNRAGMPTGGRMRAQAFDQGGQLPPGLTLAYNGTGKPETVVGPKGGRPITIMIDLGDGLAQRVEGIIDENDQFKATVGRSRG